VAARSPVLPASGASSPTAGRSAAGGSGSVLDPHTGSPLRWRGRGCLGGNDRVGGPSVTLQIPPTRLRRGSRAQNLFGLVISAHSGSYCGIFVGIGHWITVHRYISLREEIIEFLSIFFPPSCNPHCMPGRFNSDN
jgi:hypothetical protein